MAGRPPTSGDTDYLRGWNAATDPLAMYRSMTPGPGANSLTPGSQFPPAVIRRLESSLKTTYGAADGDTYPVQQHVIDLIHKHDAGHLTRAEWDELASRVRLN